MVKDIQGIVHHYGQFKGEGPGSDFDAEEDVILQVIISIHIDRYRYRYVFFLICV